MVNIRGKIFRLIESEIIISELTVFGISFDPLQGRK